MEAAVFGPPESTPLSCQGSSFLSEDHPPSGHSMGGNFRPGTYPLQMEAEGSLAFSSPRSFLLPHVTAQG